MRKPHTERFLKSLIKNKVFNEAIKAIDYSHRTAGLKPKGVMLLGPSGVGKSTIVHAYRKKFPDIALDDRTLRPILFISLHAKCTAHDIVSALLAECDDPAPDKGVFRNKIIRFNRLAASLKVELIIIDEIQHVLPEHTHRRTQEAADTIKSITTDTGIPFILVGLPHSKRLLKDDIEGKYSEDQLIRRFNAPILLSPAPLGSKAWSNLMASYQQALGVPCISLNTEQMLKRFHLATSGLHGFVANLLEFALEEVDEGEQICLEHLARAYDFCTSVQPFKGNPFLMPMSQVNRALGVTSNA